MPLPTFLQNSKKQTYTYNPLQFPVEINLVAVTATFILTHIIYYVQHLLYLLT